MSNKFLPNFKANPYRYRIIDSQANGKRKGAYILNNNLTIMLSSNNRGEKI